MYLKTDTKCVNNKLISGHLRYNNTPGSLSNRQADGSISTFLPEDFTKPCPGRTKKCTPARSPEQSRLMCNVYECEFACTCLFWRHSEWQRKNKWWQKAKGKLWVKLSSSCAECWLSKLSNSLMFVSAFVWSQAEQQVCFLLQSTDCQEQVQSHFCLKKKSFMSYGSK